jgi:hypothetical protein
MEQHPEHTQGRGDCAKLNQGTQSFRLSLQLRLGLETGFSEQVSEPA